jgi:hypothetical protein
MGIMKKECNFEEVENKQYQSRMVFKIRRFALFPVIVP